MCPDCDVNKIPKSGPAPVLLRPHELAKIGPDWESYTAWIESNDNAKQVLGEWRGFGGGAEECLSCWCFVWFCYWCSALTSVIF